MNKSDKYFNRLRKPNIDDVEKLSLKTNFLCSQCIHDCKGKVDNGYECVNFTFAYDVFELYDMIKRENINIDRFCKDYKLKKKYLMNMLLGKEFFHYKYYYCLMYRLRINDEYVKYEERFLEQNED